MELVRRLLAFSPFALVLLAAAGPQPLLAQYQKYEGVTITIIRFDPPGKPLEASELHDILPVKMGQSLHIADVRSAIERLFATGRYADIEVNAQPYRDGVALTFVTKASWFVGSISILGKVSSPPSIGQLENASALNLGEAYSDTKLKDGIAAQQRLLESNGLFRARIQPFFDWESTAEYQQVNIRF